MIWSRHRALFAWLGVVALAATLVWLVINQVGQALTPNRAAANPALQEGGPTTVVSQPGPTDVVLPATGAPTPSGLPSMPTSTPVGTAGGEPSAAPTGGTHTTSRPGGGTTRPPRTTTPRLTPTPHTSSKPAPAVTSVERRFTTDGGVITLSCTDQRIALLSIRPFDGWRAEREINATTVKVEFKPLSDGGEIHLLFGCVGGSPALLEQSNDH